MPTVVGTGPLVTNGSLSNYTFTLPTGWQAGDIILLFCSSANSVVALPTSTGATWARLGADNGVGTGTAGSARLSVFWALASASLTAPVVHFTGTSFGGFTMAVRGCRQVGDPFFVLGQSVKATASTSYDSFNGNTSSGASSPTPESVDNSLVIFGISGGISGSTSELSAVANASLTNLVKQFDSSYTAGVGANLAVVTGTLATAGPVGILTGTWASSTADITNCFAMIPAGAADTVAAPRTIEVQVYYQNNINYTWTKPYGAKWVEIIAIGGGGGGGNGRNTATAAGGGSGGGGGYTMKRFRAEDLGATLSVQVGVGGPGGASAVAGGNAGTAGTASEIEDTNVNGSAVNIVLANGGVGGNGAASGAGGAGAAGGGRGNAAASGVQGIGGQGGGPSTGTTVIPADEGGGGGASGTAGTTAGHAGGSSQYGGGGGAGGTVTGTAGTPGSGGGNPEITTGGIASPYVGLGGNGGTSGSSTVAAGAGGYPGGGGGGGGSLSTNTAGGAGADGQVIIITQF